MIGCEIWVLVNAGILLNIFLSFFWLLVLSVNEFSNECSRRVSSAYRMNFHDLCIFELQLKDSQNKAKEFCMKNLILWKFLSILINLHERPE